MDKRKEICVYIETEEEHQRKKKHDERVRSFSFHCFSIINFGAREWIATGWERIAAVAAAAFVYDIWFRWEEDFEYYFHICVHIQPTPNTNIWNAELFFPSFFLLTLKPVKKEKESERVTENEPKLSQQQGSDKFTNTWPEFYDEATGISPFLFSTLTDQTCWQKH